MSPASFSRTLQEPEREDRYSAHGLQPWDGILEPIPSAMARYSPKRKQGLTWDRRGGDQCGQATKGMWGMSWRQEAMKGVEDCDKPGGAVKRALMPGSPNQRALNP
jgi:hypothetical protein